MQQNNRRLALKLLLVVAIMFGFAFALVPLYDVFCKITGLQGKTEGQPIVFHRGLDTSRFVTVQFLANINRELPIEFYPSVTTIKIHPGQTTRISYVVKNSTAHALQLQAIPSVSPGQAARFFQKTECFCFRKQVLRAGEKREMPVVFRIDPALPKEYKLLTLSYTFFEINR